MEIMRGFLIKHKFPLIAVISVAAVCAVLFVLFYLRILKINTPDKKKYPVRGVDVSSYQGDIDWQILSQGIDFAFIKATEGSKYCDENFAYNYSEAQKTQLRVGAYHFFSFDSDGDTQAANFIANVEPYEKMLPPVVDVEFYGDYRTNAKSADDVVPQLKRLLEDLEDYYGLKPIIYATGSAYTLYVEENFSDYDIWLRSVYFTPDDGWTFWQYSDTATADGYSGEEKHIDFNVFCGTKEEFDNYSVYNVQ
jgi:lysozyme